MRYCALVVAAIMLMGAPFPVQAQQVSQQEIDNAIKKGGDCLVGKYSAGLTESNVEFELIVYTLIHADIDPSKASFLKDAIGKLITLEPSALGAKSTYRVAIQALALHSLLLKIHRNAAYAYLDKDIDAIQERIAKCGQYLVDTQLDNGQWTYSGQSVNTPEKDKIIPTGSSAQTRESKRKKPPKTVQSAGAKIAWENAVDITGTIWTLKPKSGAPAGGTTANPRTNRGERTGDNSNSQYGILGLIAAQMSGCIVPDETWRLALEWFEKCQRMESDPNLTTGGGNIGGFGYGRPSSTSANNDISYGSMTAAGIVALAACYRYLGKDPKKKDFKKEPKLVAAADWIGKNFTPSDNPGRTEWFVYYYLYGLERDGAFLETDKFGNHKWYDEGAAWLVKGQGADGSWASVGKWETSHKDFSAMNTCFAILFLKRATKDIIETGTGGGNPPIIEQK